MSKLQPGGPKRAPQQRKHVQHPNDTSSHHGLGGKHPKTGQFEFYTAQTKPKSVAQSITNADGTLASKAVSDAVKGQKPNCAAARKFGGNTRDQIG